MNIRALAGLVLFFTQAAYAQTDMKFDHINARKGLSHNTVLCVLKDSKGYMWFGSYGGLNKYDGYKITSYKQEYGNDKSLSTTGIVTICEDLEGTLWLGTYGGGLIEYNPKTEVFTDHKYLHLNRENNIIPSVRSIFEADDGTIWLATSEGLDQFDKTNNTFKSYRVNSAIPSDNSFTVIHEGHLGKMWVGTYMGMKLFDRESKSFTTYKHDAKNKNSISNDRVLAIQEDRAGMVWIGTEGGGLNRFNPATGEFKHFKNSPAHNAGISSDIVYDIKQFENDRLWIATEQGINILDLKTESFEHIVNNPYDPTSLSNNIVRCLYKDKNEILWVGTDGGGVNKADGHKKKFNLYQHNEQDVNSLSGNNVSAIHEDGSGVLWIGTNEGGLNRFDQTTGKIARYLHNGKDPSSISSNKILSLHSGKSKNLWIGTDRDGLNMLPAKDMEDAKGRGKFIHYRADTITNTLSSNVIFSVWEDRTGTVWAGTWSEGINKIRFEKISRNGVVDYRQPTITHIKYDSADASSLAIDIAFTIYEDKKGTIWAGTAGGGLDKHEIVKKVVNGDTIETDVFVHYKNIQDDTRSISNNFISGIYESRKGDLWIGTSLGLNKFVPADESFKTYTTRDGLPNNVIFGILEDAHGDLWMSTQGGISRFNPEAETFRNYTVEDGLQDNIFNADAYCLSRSGEMFFGGTNGVTSFFPDSIKDNPYLPQVMLTDFKVFNQPVPIGKSEDEPERLIRSISTADQIDLSYEDYVFSIEFSASNYSTPSKNQFAYMMEGFDEDWVYTDANNRIATYTNLNPGEYIFRVKASNGDGVWNEAGASIKISISPPFMQTLLFKVLAFAAILGLLLIIYKIRVRIIERQKRELELQITQRTKEIISQKEEIETQKENIEEKNTILERQYNEITLKNSQIVSQSKKIEEARKEIKEKNEKLEEYNATLENNVKERTEQLRATYAHLDETNKELDQFIYRSAHDLKGPIASITGLCYLGSLETKDPKVLDLLKRMEGTTDEMTNKLSRLMSIHEFNTMRVSLKPVNYRELLSETLNDIRAHHKVDDIEIKLDIEAHDDVYKSDAVLLKILLKNLIENAVKYKDKLKPDRHIHIGVKYVDGKTQISVADNGIGVPESQKNRVFDLFVIATENTKGFGLGLYEAKLIVRRLNGNIKLGDTKNGDTEFVITV